MIIIPAVDIKNGKCVRLFQGRFDSETIFSDDPVAMAKRWENEGAEIIHVIDLDGAVEKSPKNLESIKRIIESVAAYIQVGGYKKPQICRGCLQGFSRSNCCRY